MKKVLMLLLLPLLVSVANAQTTQTMPEEVRVNDNIYAYKSETKTVLKVYNTKKQALLLVKKDSSYFPKPDVRDFYYIINVLATGKQTRLTNKGYLPSSATLLREFSEYGVIENDTINATGLEALFQKYQSALPVQNATPKLFNGSDAAQTKLESVFGTKGSTNKE